MASICLKVESMYAVVMRVLQRFKNLGNIKANTRVHGLGWAQVRQVGFGGILSTYPNESGLKICYPLTIHRGGRIGWSGWAGRVRVGDRVYNTQPQQYNIHHHSPTKSKQKKPQTQQYLSKDHGKKIKTQKSRQKRKKKKKKRFEGT